MTQTEFSSLVRDTFEKKGYKKIKVQTALFCKKANVTARDPKGKKRSFKAELLKKRGKTLLQITPTDDPEWIDRLEAFEAFMED